MASKIICVLPLIRHINLVRPSLNAAVKPYWERPDCILSCPQSYQFTQVQNYAKGKDKKKGDKGKGSVVGVNDSFLSEHLDVTMLRTDIEKQLEAMKEDYSKNLSIRSSTGSIENMKVNHEGKSFSLMEIAQISRNTPKTIVLNMSSFPHLIPAALKALQTSGMNLNPQQDSTSIYIPVPRVTKEHRERLAKNAKAIFIKCRDQIKDIQNKHVKNVKKNDTMSKDVSHEITNQVTALASQYISQAEKLMEKKKTELLEEIS